MVSDCKVYQFANSIRKTFGLSYHENTPYQCLDKYQRADVRKAAEWYYRDTLFDLTLSRSASDAVRGKRPASSLKGHNLTLYLASKWYDAHIVPIRNRFINNLSQSQRNLLDEGYRDLKAGNSNYSRRVVRGPNALNHSLQGDSRRKGIFYWLHNDQSKIFGSV